MIMIKIALVIISIIFIAGETETISMPITYNYFTNFVSLELSIGTPNTPLLFILSTTVALSEILKNHNYNRTISSTLKISIQEAIQGHSYKGNMSSDIITFEDLLPLNHFSFILIDEGLIEFSDYSNQGVISLSRSTTSLLSQLYYGKVIQKRMFQLNQKTLTLGLIQNNDPNNSKSSRCKLIYYENKWACILEAIFFESKLAGITVFDTKVIFNLKRRNIIFPYSYWVHFQSMYFSPYLEKDQCEVFKGSSGWIIECEEEIASKLGNIDLYLGDDMKLILQFSDLFEEDMINMDKQVFKIYFQENAPYIEFGWNLFKKFSIGLNDEESYAEFFIPIESNDTNLQKNETGPIIENTHNAFKQSLCVFGIVFLTFGLAMLYIFQYIIKKRN